MRGYPFLGQANNVKHAAIVINNKRLLQDVVVTTALGVDSNIILLVQLRQLMVVPELKSLFEQKGQPFPRNTDVLTSVLQFDGIFYQFESLDRLTGNAKFVLAIPGEGGNVPAGDVVAKIGPASIEPKEQSAESYPIGGDQPQLADVHEGREVAGVNASPAD